MFDRGIIRTDRFLDMAPSTQNLYFHLGMESDDEGFVTPKMVMKTLGCSDDELKMLIAKGYLIPFESGVVVITDWNKNNWLDDRRIKPTEHQEEKKKLLLTDERKYELSQNLHLLSQSSIEEYRVEEYSKYLAVAEAPARAFSLKEEIQKLETNKRRDLNIIALFLEKRNPDIKTYDQFKVLLKRHLRAAKELSPFSDEQIIKACGVAEREYPHKWTIETLVKVLTK